MNGEPGKNEMNGEKKGAESVGRPAAGQPRSPRPRRAVRRAPGEISPAPAADGPRSEGAARRTGKKPETASADTVKVGAGKTIVSDAVVRSEPEADKKKKKATEKEGSEGRHVSNIVKVIAYVTFVLVASALASVFIIMGANDVYAFVKSDEPVEVVIPEDATLNDVTSILAENRIIKYPGLFKMYARIKKDPCDFRPGTYTISASLGYKELLSSFKPKTLSGVSWVTIPEGYTTDEIIDLLTERGIGTREKYIDVINNYDFDYWFIDELGDDWASTGRFYRLDGYLFPDSYEFYNASSEVTVINRMLYRFSKIYTKEYRLGAEAIGMTNDDVIKLASIIEKEAGAPSDFSIVSSVFHNRMNAPWDFPYFESDATIVYAIQHATGRRPRLTGDDLNYDSPYNSYTHAGFPPGPICSPSNSAILAALNPVDSGYYFFVSSGNRTYFSVTRAEHDAKVAEIRAGMEEDQYAPEEVPEN